MFARALTLFALIAPFFFPWPFAAALALLASLQYPPVALAVGLEIDALYFARGVASVPLASVWGLAVMLVLVVARRFVHTRLLVS
ncbi:MAG TPA: hypothetical protein VF829_00650 [Candidatus Paceibacterota bacterium]